jgi:predicted HAD superfamily Cof-like phosphohydrolase
MKDIRERSIHQIHVEQFMQLAGQSIPLLPSLPSLEDRKRMAFITLEEALEKIYALGFTPTLSHRHEGFEFIENHNPDLIEIVDGALDGLVVNTATLSGCGVPDVSLLAEVDTNNLNKFGPGGYRNPKTGKWIKPPNHKPPRIKEILMLLGWKP